MVYISKVPLAKVVHYIQKQIHTLTEEASMQGPPSLGAAGFSVLLKDTLTWKPGSAGEPNRNLVVPKCLYLQSHNHILLKKII